MNLREREREREREQVPAAIEGEAFEGGCEQGRTQDFNLGAEISEKKNFQIRIHIVLINYQPRQIPKNHCFLIY